MKNNTTCKNLLYEIPVICNLSRIQREKQYENWLQYTFGPKTNCFVQTNENSDSEKWETTFSLSQHQHHKQHQYYSNELHTTRTNRPTHTQLIFPIKSNKFHFVKSVLIYIIFNSMLFFCSFQVRTHPQFAIKLTSTSTTSMYYHQYLLSLQLCKKKYFGCFAFKV